MDLRNQIGDKNLISSVAIEKLFGCLFVDEGD